MGFTHMNVHDLYLKNKFYGEVNFNRFSAKKLHDKMYLFSELCSTVYPGYKVD